MTAPPNAAAEPIARNFQSAADAVGSEHKLDRPAELIGNEIADNARAVAGFPRRNNRRSADLLPFEDERLACACRCIANANARIPDHRGVDKAPYLAALVTSSCRTVATAWVASAASTTSGPSADGIAFADPGCQLAVHELGEADALPPAAAEQSVSIGHRVDATVENLEELVHRGAALAAALRNDGNAGQRVFHTVVELCDQQILVLSARLSSVTSRVSPFKRTMCPPASNSAFAVSSSQTSRPSGRTKRNFVEYDAFAGHTP